MKKTKMNNNYITIGNVSSILKAIGLITAGYLVTFLASQGIQLPIQTETIATIIGTLLGLGLSYIDMKYNNNFFKKDTITIPAKNLTSEQQQEIQEILDKEIRKISDKYD